MNDGIQLHHAELMKTAGLIVTDDQPDPVTLPSCLEGWIAVNNSGNVPLHNIDDTKPPSEYLPEVNQLWLETARAQSLFTSDGTFIISSESPTDPRATPWIRVRLSDHTRMAQTLHGHPGEPDFVTMSNTGTTVVGVQTHEHGIWIIHEEI